MFDFKKQNDGDKRPPPGPKRNKCPLGQNVKQNCARANLKREIRPRAMIIFVRRHISTAKVIKVFYLTTVRVIRTCCSCSAQNTGKAVNTAMTFNAALVSETSISVYGPLAWSSQCELAGTVGEENSFVRSAYLKQYPSKVM